MRQTEKNLIIVKIKINKRKSLINIDGEERKYYFQINELRLKLKI